MDTRYPSITNKFFIRNRQKLSKHLKPNSLVILLANDVMPISGDSIYPFIQNSDFFYFTGIEKPKTKLIFYPDAKENINREVLFIPNIDPKVACWDGYQYTLEDAQKISGIQNIQFLDTFEETLHKLMLQAEHVYLNGNENPRAGVTIIDSQMQFVEACKQKYPLHKYKRLAIIMSKLRTVKSAQEITLIKKAISIIEESLRQVIQYIKPNTIGYYIEAELSKQILKTGARGFAFDPIIASGKNTCILHYVINQNILKKEDLVLIDIGANYANYNSDMTRVFPVKGSFSKRQKEIYQSVLHVMTEAKKLLKPKMTLNRYHELVGEIMTEQLSKLKLLTKKDTQNKKKNQPAYKKYFMHGTSHHLGLEVHDIGTPYDQLKPNMVLTVEPGIYIPEENIGVRIEDVVVVKENQVETLSTFPKEVAEIEHLMKVK